MRDLKNIEPPTINNQIIDWKYNSHYWVDSDNSICQCKWCGRISPNILVDIDICEKNPEIEKLLNNKHIRYPYYKGD